MRGREDLQKLLRHFYADVRQHALLGPVFNRQIRDWPAHIEKIAAFWSQIAGGPKKYSGGMPMKHLPLGIELCHFQAWLQLWEFNCSAHLPPAEAREMIALAHEIARRLKAILRLESFPDIRFTA